MYHDYDPKDVRPGDMLPPAGGHLVLVRVVSLRAAPRRGFGLAFAGVAEGVGENVTTIKPGDAVFGLCDGAFAGYLCAPQDDIALKPASLSFDLAAAIALRVLASDIKRRRADLQTLAELIATGALDPAVDYTP